MQRFYQSEISCIFEELMSHHTPPPSTQPGSKVVKFKREQSLEDFEPESDGCVTPVGSSYGTELGSEFEVEFVRAASVFDRVEESTPCPVVSGTFVRSTGGLSGRVAGSPGPVSPSCSFSSQLPEYAVPKGALKEGQHMNYYRTILRTSFFECLRTGKFEDLRKFVSYIPYVDSDYMDEEFWIFGIG